MDLQLVNIKQISLKYKSFNNQIEQSNFNIEIIKTKMSLSQSKLMLQLTKEQKVFEKNFFNQQKIEDLYTTISKLQPKNLMLIQFLTLIIQKNFIKNSHKIQTFVEMFEEIKGKKLEQEKTFSMMNKPSLSSTQNAGNTHNSSTTNTSSNGTQAVEKEQQKFNKKKFLKLLKDIAKMLYPGEPRAYETLIYQRLITSDQEQSRMKIDDNVKKFLNQEVISEISKYNIELEVLFETYMPQNYNERLQFSWNEIKLLEKKLPIICILKILFESEICPQLLSPLQFLQITSKMIPPLNQNHKEVMFYYSETFNSYMREYIFYDEIKLLEGDIGVSFIEFSIVLARIATEIWKDSKQDFVKAIEKLFTTFNITDTLKAKKQFGKPSKMQSTILSHFKFKEKNLSVLNSNSKFFKTKQLFKKQNHQFISLIDDSDSETKNQNLDQNSFAFKRIDHEAALITKEDLFKIKRNLDDELGPIPQKIVIEKQNQGYFNVNQKFTVIGEQLPKLQQKNKPAAKSNPKDKQEDPLLGFKAEEQQKTEISWKSSSILNRKKKLRANSEFPVILSEVFYPNSFSDPSIIHLNEDQEIYLQTTYIHLGQRMYEEAYLNFQKAQRLIKSTKRSASQVTQADKRLSIILDYYLQVLEAQIFEAAGKDEAALIHYYNARQISFNFDASEVGARAYAYTGLSSALYHLEEYQFALRCLLKAKQIYSGSFQKQSVGDAILMNNIGSCYMMMDRNQEAVKYFNFSHQVFDLKIGRFDERTLVVQQNIVKNKKAFIEQMPSFKTMWKTYLQKGTTLPTEKPAKVKK